jgi:hypothetical protein
VVSTRKTFWVDVYVYYQKEASLASIKTDRPVFRGNNLYTEID